MQSASLPPEPQATAPDGSAIRFLLKGSRGELNHFTLPPHQTSTAVVHRSIEEIWYVLEGQGQVWRQEAAIEEVLDLGPGVSFDIPTGARFQFRNTGPEPLSVLIATMPPWPGNNEATPIPGPWTPTQIPSPSM